MNGTRACFGAADLQRLLVGQLSEAETTALERHLAWCRPCLEHLQTLQPHDALLDAVTRAALEPPPDAAAEALVAGLRRARPPHEALARGRPPAAPANLKLPSRPAASAV
jgi:hypothetical protein